MVKEFSQNPKAIYQREWRKNNPEKARAGYTQWRVENRERYLELQRRSDKKRQGTRPRRKNQQDADLKRWCKKYGITVEIFYAVRDSQNNQCKICGDQPPEGRRLYIDHNHATDKFRGLLCNTCNSGIGLFRDQPNLLRLAAEYVENYKWDARTT